MRSQIAAAMLVASLGVPPALAGEYTTYHYLEAPAGALQPCRAGMLLSLPELWQSGDGAVVLLTMGQTYDGLRDVLVAALLYERAAVLELGPVHCDAAPADLNSVIASATDALNAMARTMGAGLTVAIGYGPGTEAILDVVQARAADVQSATGVHYAAAVAIGDGPVRFATGQPLPAQERAPSRLATLCRALAALAGGMGATPERPASAAASEACSAAMVGEAPPNPSSVLATAHP